jgi:hypothetical protein
VAGHPIGEQEAVQLEAVAPHLESVVTSASSEAVSPASILRRAVLSTPGSRAAASQVERLSSSAR